MRTSLLLALVAAFALIIAGPTMAQTPTQDAYGGVLGEQEQGGGGPSGEEAPTAPLAVREQAADTSPGSLPFTGLDVLWIVLAGAGLIALGLGLRRAGPAGRKPS